MLGTIFLFSSAVTVSLLWIIGVAFYIYAQIGFSALFGLPLADVSVLAGVAFLPVFAFWLVIALVHNVFVLKSQGRALDMLLIQNRRSADHAEAMVRTLLETQVQTKSALVLDNIPLFIDELNDLLCDIEIRFGLLPAAHAEKVWFRIGDGDRWAFCKIVLQNAENTPMFDSNLKAQLMRDEVLMQYVRQFCYRFEQMFSMLEHHDEDKFLTNLFQECAMGRVYARFLNAARDFEDFNRPAPAAPVVRAPAAQETPEDVEVMEDSFDADDFYAQSAARDDAPEETPEADETDEAQDDGQTQEESPDGSDAQPAPVRAPFGFLRPTR